MSRRAIGYFVHHQGRGHAERCAALVDALPADRPVSVFCAKPEVLPALRSGVEVIAIPSLFEPTGAEARGLDRVAQPDTLHCAPLGWPGIRRAMHRLVEWFDRADPALLVCDVSAEVAQLARLCSVPHVSVLQHGVRDDPGHLAAWTGAVGLLAPFDRSLVQEDWSEALLARACFAGGLGVRTTVPAREGARARLGIGADESVYLVICGGGGEGFASAPLGVAARTFPDVSWQTIGPIRNTWHATEPSNLTHHGWVDDALDRIAAADLVVGSVGNTVCQQVLAAGRPWIAVPEWCYFDEQVCKARVLDAAGMAHREPYLPSYADGWRRAVEAALAGHDAVRQRAAVRADADAYAAGWLDELCSSLWDERPRTAPARSSVRKTVDVPAASRAPVSVLTIARGRDEHLRNLVLGLEQQSRAPEELIIGVMQDAPYEGLPATRFPVRQIPVPGEELPLAAARNAVARHAASDALVFLDVDCVPAPDLVADYAARLRPGAGLLMGEVHYLPESSARPGWTFETLERDGVVHDDRAGTLVEALERCDDYRCFWSLNFGIHHEDFKTAGGFDERYRGYGGEDTDFGRTLAERGVPISWLRGARAYHQFHAHCMPPVHHLEAIVRNAEIFADKWGHRTMEHWLYCFGLLGLIEDTPEGLRVVDPRPEVDAAAFAPADGKPYASTRRAIALLEARLEESHRRDHGEPPPPERLDRKRFLHRPAAPAPLPNAAGSGPASGVSSGAGAREREPV